MLACFGQIRAYLSSRTTGKASPSCGVGKVYSHNLLVSILISSVRASTRTITTQWHYLMSGAIRCWTKAECLLTRSKTHLAQRSPPLLLDCSIASHFGPPRAAFFYGGYSCLITARYLPETPSRSTMRALAESPISLIRNAL